MSNWQYTPKIESLKQDIATLKHEISQKETTTDALYDTHISEAEGAVSI